jgi:hypothetical protein
MALDPAVLAEIKCLYGDRSITVAEIGRRHNRSAASISQLARKQGWPMRRGEQREAQRREARARLAAKLCKAITTKLEQMEKAMRRGELCPADCEREAKSVGSMVGSMEKVLTTVPHAEERQPQPASAGASEDTSDGPSTGEAERLHREIMERFERIQRRRDAEAGSP